MLTLTPAVRSVRTIEMDVVTRRAVLSGVVAGLASLAGCVGGSATGRSDLGVPDFDGWLSGTTAYDGVADRTGQSLATVVVGGDDGLSFAPAAIRVDSGTTVRWEWTGGGSAHNVVAKDRSFESGTYAEAGRTFEQIFDTAGVVKYLCVPHEYAGMKGVVVVDD